MNNQVFKAINESKLWFEIALLAIGFIAAMIMLTAIPTRADIVQPNGLKFIPFTTNATNPVTGWYNIQKGEMYDKANNQLDDEPTWTDCVTAILPDAFCGVYEDTPESTMPTGYYVWRLWDSAAPASTDVELKAKLIYWNQSAGLITEMADL